MQQAANLPACAGLMGCDLMRAFRVVIKLAVAYHMCVDIHTLSLFAGLCAGQVSLFAELQRPLHHQTATGIHVVPFFRNQQQTSMITIGLGPVHGSALRFLACYVLFFSGQDFTDACNSSFN